MNILYYNWSYPPRGGGVGSYTYNMARSLQKIGHNVYIVTGRHPEFPDNEIINGVNIFRIYDYKEIGSKKVLEKVKLIIRDYSIDIIEGADFLGDCVQIFSMPARPPVVIKAHSCNVLNILNESQILKWWQRITVQIALWTGSRRTRREKAVIQRADLLLAPSQRILHEMEQQGLRLPKFRYVLPNPILPLENPSAKQEAETPTLLMVGRLDVGKGIQFLPNLLSKLVIDFPDLQFEIAGGDSYARGIGSLKNWLCHELGDLVKHVSFLGLLDGEALEAAFSRAWVVIIPSRWDNFPTVLLEAMIRGKPAVASTHGGMPEMLEGTKCRAALPESDDFYNSLRELLISRKSRAVAGKSMKMKAEKDYSPENIAKNYVRLVTNCFPELLKVV